jgi:hypothetical protein
MSNYEWLFEFAEIETSNLKFHINFSLCYNDGKRHV